MFICGYEKNKLHRGRKAECHPFWAWRELSRIRVPSPQDSTYLLPAEECQGHEVFGWPDPEGLPLLQMAEQFGDKTTQMPVRPLAALQKNQSALRAGETHILLAPTLMMHGRSHTYNAETQARPSIGIKSKHRASAWRVSSPRVQA